MEIPDVRDFKGFPVNRNEALLVLNLLRNRWLLKDDGLTNLLNGLLRNLLKARALNHLLHNVLLNERHGLANDEDVKVKALD